MLQSKDSDVQSSESIGQDSRYSLTGIAFVWAPDDKLSVPNTISVEISDPRRETGQPLLLEKVSQARWEHNGIIEVAEEITFVARSEEVGHFGHVHLTRAEIGEITTRTSVDDEFTRHFRNIVDRQPVVSVTMSFKVFVVRSNEDLMARSNQHLLVDRSVAQDLEEPSVLRSRGDQFLKRFRSSRSRDDINNSVRAFEQAIQLSSADIHLIDFQYDCATALLERHNLTGDLADLNRSISLLDHVVKGTPNGSTALAQRLGFLSSLFVIRSKCTGNLDDISKAIETLQRGIDVTPQVDAILPERLNNIALLLWRRFRSTGNLADISDAILAQQKLVDLVHRGHADMPRWLDGLSLFLEYRFQYTGDLDDISTAISTLSRAIELTLEGHVDAARRLSKRGILFRKKFQYAGDFADLSNAIEDQEKAVHLIPKDHHEMHELLGNLGNSYLCRFDYRGDPADISEAVTALESALHLAPDDNPDIPGHWSNLGNSLARRFECTGNLSDLSEAISAQQKAVELTPDGRPNLPSLLNNLGVSYQMRFDVTGDLIDISEAIAAHQKSVHLTPESHADMSGRLNNLGISFQCRSQRTADITDISEAIDAHRKAVRLCHEDDTLMPILLSNLGNSLYGRFRATKDLVDISEAISSHQEAIRLTPEDQLSMAGRLRSLGLSLKNRFELSEDIKDLDEAIDATERAIELTPENHPDMPSGLNTLGIAFQSRFEHTKNPTDLSKAISAQERAIHLTADNHANLPGLLRNIGISFELKSNPADIKEAISKYKLAASLITGPPSERLKAATRWIDASKLIDDRLETLDAYQVAIELVSQVAGMEQTIGLRHRKLFDLPDLSNAAAATAFSLGRHKTALEWLEQGRCIVWNQLNNLRTPLDDIASFDAELANNLLRVSRGLENAGLRDETVTIGTDVDIMVEKMALQDDATASAKLAQEWDQLLKQIRNIPTFENFLLPARYCNLIARVPKGGPVVVINIHEDRCDAVALVAGTDDPLHVPLDQFSYNDAVRLLHLLRSNLSAHRLRTHGDSDELEPVNETRGVRPYKKSDDAMQTVLRELWLGVVKPVLEVLDLLHPSSDLSRIWWCPTGPLAFLPIHAAGLYNETHTSRISDYVISSYIPTVSSLLERTRVSRTTERTSNQVLMVGQRNTPGLPPLPGTGKEIKAIQEKFSTANVSFLSLEGDSATVARTMKELESHSCIHFACHATQDDGHPLKSGFDLSDGRLELWKFLQIQNLTADFAFLSACQTSKGDDWLSEEVIHLAAGVLAAGYRGVVATMWSIQDRYGLKVADEFYTDLLSRRRRMRDGGEGLVGSAGAAHALHYAIQRLREELGDSPSALLAWVPYVHMGD